MKISIKKKSIIQPVVLTLDLTGEEAMLLRGIFDMIGGNPIGNTPRAFTDSIARALHAEGVGSYDLSASKGIDLPALWADLTV